VAVFIVYRSSILPKRVTKMYDIVFLHPPTSFSKLKHPLSGIFGALVGSTDILAHEPVGMISMVHDLLRMGYKAKIFNLGKTLLDLRYKGVRDFISIENFVKDLKSSIYGIGLHWAAHAPGAIELARLVKEYHPDSLVLLGGITSTYYYEEILNKFKFVDLVVLGEVDGTINEIVDKLLARRQYEYLPNIAYRKNGEIVSTEMKAPKKKNLLYVRGLGDQLIEPNSDFSRGNRESMASCMIPLVYGCEYNCPFCGGSNHFYRKYFHRNGPEVLDAEDVVENMKKSVDQGVCGFSLFGDVRLLGDAYWKRLTKLLSREQMPVDLYLELFSPATPEYMEAWRKVTSGKIVMTFSPESADQNVRRILGKNYSNEQIVEQVSLSIDLGIRLSLGFLFALPKQDFASIRETQNFINSLCHKFNRLISYMFEPFLFVDPGCLIFDYPEKYGYKIKDRTLEGLIKALTRPHWYYSINYSTRWMSKKDVVEAIFFVGSSRNRLYMELLGPSRTNWLHQTLIFQQKELVTILENNPNLKDEEVETLMERIIDHELRHMNFSITGPDLDLREQTSLDYSISAIFKNTVGVINKCYKEVQGQKDLLTLFEQLGFFHRREIPRERYTDQLAMMKKAGEEIYEIPFKLPKTVWNRFYELLSILGLSLEKGLIEEFIRYDWALFLVNLYTDVYLKHLFGVGNVPQNIEESDVLLPLKNAYVKLNYKCHGKAIKKPNWLTMEKGPTYVLISYNNMGYVVGKGDFDFLRGCGYRISFQKFYNRAGNLVREPKAFFTWLLREGLILLCSSGSKVPTSPWT